MRGSSLLGRLASQPWELSMGNDEEKEGVVKVLSCSLCRSVVGAGEGRWLYLWNVEETLVGLSLGLPVSTP